MKWPNLKHLHYLVILHKEQHFHRAALHCHVSQSTLSTAIQNLEEQFGAQLLERDHKTFLFTPFGLELVESGVRHIHVTCLHQHAVTLPRRLQQVYHDASKYRWGHRQTTSQSAAYVSSEASLGS